MKKKFVDSLTNFIIKNKDCDEKKIKIIRYGLEGLYLSITKMLVLLIIVIFTNSLYEYILLLITYLIIRKYSFGLHANTSLMCWLTTIPIYVGGSLIIKYCYFNDYIIYIIWIYSFVSFLLWAPADTPKRPLIHANTRKKQKSKTCIICILYLVLILCLDNIKIINALIFALFVQAIMINPLVYRLTKTPFNNYKLYPNKV